MSQKGKCTYEAWREFGKGIILEFSSHSLHQSLRVCCCFIVVFWVFSLSNRNILFFFFSVSLSQVMVIKSDIINYLVHSSNVEDELGHKVEVYTMSKELPIYINLQTDKNCEHQSTEALWYLMPRTFYCLVGLQSLNKQPLLSWKNEVVSNNGSLIRKRQNAWCHPEPSLQSSVSSDT